MKILVPVKRVPDPYGRVSLQADGQIDFADVKWVLNPFDEIALEEAVSMRERGLQAEIVAVSVGGGECEPILRNALAMGADRALLMECDTGAADSGVVAFLLHAAVLGSSTFNRGHFASSAATLGLFLEPSGLPRLDFGLGAI